jgi:AraC-like DNA-binding protein
VPRGRALRCNGDACDRRPRRSGRRAAKGAQMSVEAPAESPMSGSVTSAAVPVLGRPHPAVKPYLTKGYAGIGRDVPAHSVIVPASAAVPLVFKLEDSPHRPPAFSHGADIDFTVMEGSCAPSYLELALSPPGAYSVLGVPLHELTGRLVDLVDLFGPEAARLTDRLRDTTPWARRFQLIDEFLLRRAVEGPQPSPEVVWSWQHIQRTGGGVAIRALADGVGWSHKHLIAMFKRQVGLPPQMVARLARFERLRRLLDRHPAITLTRIAAELGFADQAHLNREFKTFSGLTPTQYMANLTGWMGPIPLSSGGPARHALRPPSTAGVASRPGG